MREPVYRWEALRQISKVSRVALANLLKSRDHSLEQAAHALFPEDIPKGASQKASINLAGKYLLHLSHKFWLKTCDAVMSMSLCMVSDQANHQLIA